VTDQLAVVANPARNTVSPVDVGTGIVGPEVAVGTYPQFVLANGNRVYVVNANLVNFTPAGPGSVTVLNAGLQVVRTIPLTGINPGPAVIRNNRLYVLNAGTFGGNNGSISEVNLGNLSEERVVTGFTLVSRRRSCPRRSSTCLAEIRCATPRQEPPMSSAIIRPGHSTEPR
jgi:hypothetical protein